MQQQNIPEAEKFRERWYILFYSHISPLNDDFGSQNVLQTTIRGRREVVSPDSSAAHLSEAQHWSWAVCLCFSDGILSFVESIEWSDLSIFSALQLVFLSARVSEFDLFTCECNSPWQVSLSCTRGWMRESFEWQFCIAPQTRELSIAAMQFLSEF